MKKISILLPLAVLCVSAATLGLFQLLDSPSHSADKQPPSFPDIDKTTPRQIAERDKLELMLDPKDANSIFTIFDAINNNRALSQDCHEIGHDIGHKAYEMYGFSGAMLLNKADRNASVIIGEICAGGYMHGVLEELLVDKPDIKDNARNMCLSVPPENRASCFHGIGHGLMFIHNRNVPDSLADCEVLGKKANEASCFEGVWMEMFWGDTRHADGVLGWSLDQPLQPCIEAPDIAKPTCYLYANLGYLRTHTQDFAGAINLCSNPSLQPQDQQFCLKGVGMTMMQRFLNHHLSNPESFVAGLGTGDKQAYYQGLIAYARLSGVSEKNLDAFCDSSEGDKDICTTLLGRAS